MYNIFRIKEIISQCDYILESEGYVMPNILPVSDLRNYNEVLKNCRVGEPVFLTKNGRGRYVLIDMDEYEREIAEKKLILKLQEAEEAVKDGKAWISLDDLKATMSD